MNAAWATPVLASLLAACTAYRLTNDGAQPWTVAEVRAEEPATGTRLTLGEVIITSPRSADREAFFVQDPGGGDGSGLRVAVRGSLPQWPPAVGTPVRLSGRIRWTGADPLLDLSALADGEVLGGPELPVTVEWSEAGDLGFALVRLADVTVTSPPDPVGHADTDTAAGLSDAFGVPLPGWNAAGDLTGIVVEPDRIAPRNPADWTGPLEPDPTPTTTIAAIRAGDWPDGTPVVVDAIQAVPWSRDGRHTLLQDDAQAGLWVDTGGFGTPDTHAGDRRPGGARCEAMVWGSACAPGRSRRSWDARQTWSEPRWWTGRWLPRPSPTRSARTPGGGGPPPRRYCSTIGSWSWKRWGAR
ncbi:MAG: hypothetical protein JRJ84_18460 [Deltaproteobacteria bacterium]|nr:hypothetical protein [Deltaproteobacteria bacterium]